MAESEFGLEIGDDEWWKEAEARVLRDARRARRRTVAKKVAKWSPLALVIVLMGATGTWLAQGGRLPGAGVTDEAADVLALPLTDAQLAEPFRGTLAEQFGSGPAAFVLPPAKPVGKHAAAEVAANLQSTKNLLVLTRLDPRMVERRDPSAFLAALSPRDRAHSQAELAKPGATGIGSALTRLAPGSTLLAPPRFQGRMTVRARSDGDVEIATDYVFVYALKPSWAVADRTETHVVVRSQVVFVFTNDDRWSDTDQGVAIGDSHVHLSNVSCANANRDLLALPDESELLEGDGTDDTEGYYRADGAVPDEDTCTDPSPTTSPRPTATPSPSRPTTYT